MTEKCDKCGKKFDSERGLHIHQAQKHKEEENEESEETNTTENQTDNTDNLSQRQQGLTLNIKQVAYGSFAVGLLAGMLLGGIFLGGLGSNAESVGLPSPGNGVTSDDGNSGGQLVELSSTEFPYEGLEAGIGEGERTFGNTTINVDGEPYIGSPDAEVTAVSYEDFECPFCSQYNQNAYRQIVQNFVQPGEVQYFFKNLPLQNLHPWAESSAIASECALNQDAEAFWTFKAGFFSNQEALGNAHKSGNFDKSMYRWAEQTALDVNQFRQCYDNKEELSEVNQDKQEAADNGAQATPSIFVNAKLLEGAQPYSRFETVINDALQ